MANIGQKIADCVPFVQKQFASGSRGYYGGGKLVIDGVAHQVTCSVVEIGSKPGTKAYAERHKSESTANAQTQLDAAMDEVANG